jgi:hypothetical protein
MTEVMSLEKREVGKILAGMSRGEKREVLSSIVSALLKDLNEADKAEMLQAVTEGRRGGRRLAALVDE